MSKSFLYGVNTSTQTVLPNGIVDLGVPKRRYGCNLSMENGAVSVGGSGYYDVTVNITASITGTGLVTLTLYKDGVPIDGAKATTTVATTGNTISLVVPTGIRQISQCDVSQITAVISGALTSASVSNATVLARKD